MGRSLFVFLFLFSVAVNAESAIQMSPGEPAIQLSPNEPAIQLSPNEPAIQLSPNEPAIQLSSGEPAIQLPHKEVTLENGLTLYMVKYPSPGKVAYQLPVRVGSRNEVESGKTGFAHFFEHLMFRGTKNRSAKEFGDLYVRAGNENNAWTWWDMTNYHGEVASDNLEIILEAEADRFQNLFFTEKALRDEAGAVLGEYNKNISDPAEVLSEKLYQVAFQVHTYGHTTMGFLKDVKDYPNRYADVFPFFKTHYRPSNTSIVLVGDIDFEAAESLVKKHFGAWTNPDLKIPEIPAEPEQSESRMFTIEYDREVPTLITMAYKKPAFKSNEPDTFALDLVGRAYFSDTSDFQKEYVYDKQWLASASYVSYEMKDPGLVEIQMELSKEGESKIYEVIAGVVATVEKAATQLLTEEKMNALKAEVRNENINSLYLSADGLASAIATTVTLEPGLATLDRIQNQKDTLTAETVRLVAQKIFNKNRLTTVILKGKKS